MNELDIELICANTPQAKGRVERANATLQDRLVKELRLRNISSMAQANMFLPEFRLELNRRFQKPASLNGDAHRKIAQHEDLISILAYVQERVLSKNLTFQFGTDLYRIDDRACKPGFRVRVERNQNGIRVQHAGRTLTCALVGAIKNTPLADRTGISERRSLRVPNPKKGHKPAPDHPWTMRTGSAADPDISAWETPDITALC